MIGGTDISIPTEYGATALDIAVRLAMRLWPKAVFENAETGRVFERYDLIEFTGCEELLIYENAEKAVLWHELGADTSLRGTMIYLLISPQELTVVVDDDPPAHIKSLVSSIRDAIASNRFLVKGIAA